MIEVFRSIYKNKTWACGETVSGPGSTLEQTAAIRDEIPRITRELGIRSLLDIPCGDFYWISSVDLHVEKYIGADLLPEIIEENLKRYPNRDFRCLDITEDSLPEVDLILCRDSLVHFSFEHALRAVANIKRSCSTYLLTTTFPSLSKPYLDLPLGKWRPLNLELAPLNFPPPLGIINEKCTHDPNYPDKSLALWRIREI